jgi:N6-L-threonylcarbamoyladenine synthase
MSDVLIGFVTSLRTCLLQFDPNASYSLAFPPSSLCTGMLATVALWLELIQFVLVDNAVMIAWASMRRFLANDTDDYSIGLRPKWSIEDLS